MVQQGDNAKVSNNFSKMAMLSIKVSIAEKQITKTMQFDPTLLVSEACRIVREKMQEVPMGDAKDYGMFLSDEDTKKGVWLEGNRPLEYYLIRDGDILEYKKKMRNLRVRMLDGSVKTVLVDDSQPVANLMVVICTKIGITNHDEYSLVRDPPEEIKESNTGTLTLRRRKDKMEQLKKKLKTDDDLNWVDHSKTLRDQNIDESETLLLRRKYFFSDQNVDSRDPVQLNLLYVQARDAILSSTHPVTVDQACQFGGIQCQIQFGDHVDSKHKPGFLDLKEFLPKDFYKTKGIEKKVYVEHKKFSGLSELEAKVKYVSLARSLKTYGVTFFLVKEKMKGKNKLVPRLIGVTKDKVLRLDEKTKEILKTWPLTTVRRWAASPNSFTLDFGDYADSYYSVQTPEGEQISQLIAGYIDIIIKKQRSLDHFGIEGDEGSTMVEDNVSPAKATFLQQNPAARLSQISTGSVSIPAVLRAGANGEQYFGHGQVQPAQFGDVKNQAHTVSASVAPQHTKVHSSMTEPQIALLTSIDSGRDAIDMAQKELDVTKVDLPQLGTDPASLEWKQNTLDVKRQTVSSQIAAMNAATAQVITHTSWAPEEMDHPAVGAAISTIATNLPEMSKDVKVIAALMEDSGSSDKLIDAARSLCSAFSDLLKAAEPESKEPRQSLLDAAVNVGEASHAVLYTIGEEEETDREVQDILLGLAKAVANAAANLVLKSKNVSSKCEDQPTRSKVINAASQCALTTSQLVACSKVVAPSIKNSSCQHQLLGAAREVSRAVEGVVIACQDPGISSDEVNGAAGKVTDALQDLMNHVSSVSRSSHPGITIEDEIVGNILDSSDRIYVSTGNTGEMVRQAKILAKATSQLIQAIQGEAEHADSDIQKRLMAAVKLLADATTKMVEAAKGCANNPQDEESQNALCRAVDELKQATSAAASGAMKRKLIHRLELAAKDASAMATQNIAAAQGASHHNTDPNNQEELRQSCKSVATVIPKVIHSVKGIMADVNNPEAQRALIYSTSSMIEPCRYMIHSSRAAVSTVSDPSSALQLSNACQNMMGALKELQDSLDWVRDACGSFELDNALQEINKLIQDLDECLKNLDENKLQPLPKESKDQSDLQLATACKEVGSSMAQLLTAAVQGNEAQTGMSARSVAMSLTNLTDAAHKVGATSEDGKPMLDSAKEVMIQSIALLEQAKATLDNPIDSERQQILTQVAKSISQALTNCLNCLPIQKQLDSTIQYITESSQILNRADEFPDSRRPTAEVQSELKTAAANLTLAAGQVVESAPTPNLGEYVDQFGHCYNKLLDSGVEIMGQTKSVETRSKMVTSMKTVTIVSSKLLVAAKSSSVDPHSPNTKNSLTRAAQIVTESVNDLIEVCTQSVPGQRECDSAIKKIQSMKPYLQTPDEPVNDTNYADCLGTVVEKSKGLGDAMTGVRNHAKDAEVDKFCESVKHIAEAVCVMLECAVQGAYLIGISDPDSVAGRPGLVDVSLFSRAGQAIQGACELLVNPSSLRPQIIAATTVIAKHTSSLCNGCRLASSKTSDPVAKRQFVQAAKDVANTTASLVKGIKVLDQDISDANRKDCSRAIGPLMDAVNNLTTFASSTDFSSIPAKLSNKAKADQEPVCNAGHSLLEGSCDLLATAKKLILNAQDSSSWQELSICSSHVSDAIIQLANGLQDQSPNAQRFTFAVEKIVLANQLLEKLQKEGLTNGVQSIPDRTIREKMESLISELLNHIENIRAISKSQPELIGNNLVHLSELIEALTRLCISPPHSAAILDQTRSVVECSLQLTYASKQCGGNVKNTEGHKEVDDTADGLKDALHDLLHALDSLDTSGHIDSLNQSLAKLELDPTIKEQESYADYQARMVIAAKEVAKVSQDMVSKSNYDPSQLETLAGKLCKQYSCLATDTPGCIGTTTSLDVGNNIKESIKELGTACQELIKNSSKRLSYPNDNFSHQGVVDASSNVSEKVAQVLSSLNAGARGIQACSNAASTVSGIIGDLETTIMFATAGTLHPENERESFSDHRENILKTARALVEDTKTLVSGAASSQEQLALAAQNAVTTIVQLAEVVKFGAASLGSTNTDAQVLLINAVKDVTSALGDLILATKTASGKNTSDLMMQLKESAKTMVTNVTSLLNTVKGVEDEHARGTRAMESTVEAIRQEIRAYDSNKPPSKKMSAEELVRITKPVTLATSKTVAAGNSCRQEDIIVAANMSRKAISDFLVGCKGASYQLENNIIKQNLSSAGYSCAHSYQLLVEQVLVILQKPSTEGKQKLITLSRMVAAAVSDVVGAAEQMKGQDWVDPDDLTVIAEAELLGAANSIDAAAKKLAHLKPRRNVKETDENLNFDEMILEAAKSITSASSALVKAASAAQRDLVTQGKVGATPKHMSEDGQWSEGLVSAAKMVAAATHSLVEAANLLVHGQASREKLISAAKQVASSTAQLLVACQVKAEPGSVTMKRLQVAGNAVKKATDNLVLSAQQSLAVEEEERVEINARMVGGITQEIVAREEILKKERELEEAIHKLAAIRRAKYGNRSPEDRGGLSPSPLLEEQ